MVKKLLRRLLLFPLMMFIGIEGETATTTDAGAEADTSSAEMGSTEVTTETDNTTGAEPDTTDADQLGGEVEGTEDGALAPTGIKQTTFEQRFQELEAKSAAKIAELESKFAANQTATTKPDFIDLDPAAVNRHLAGMISRERELQDEISLDPHNADPALMTELFALQNDRTSILQQIQANEGKKNAFMQNAQAQQHNAQMMVQVNEQIAKASETVRTDASITPEVWKQGEDFFQAERAAKPLLDAQYREKVMVQGPIAAMLFAKEYVTANMGAKQQEATAKKEAAKAGIPGGKTSTSTSQTKDFKGMSDEDFNQELSRIKFGQ